METQRLKQFLKNVFFLTFFLQCFSGHTQHIDWVNAPSNPVGYKFHKNHFNLKGDIYSSGEKIFDTDGHLLENNGTRYYYENGKLVSNNYGDTFKTDSRGNVTEYIFDNIPMYFTYNSKNQLIGQITTNNENVSHIYDNEDRIKTTTTSKDGVIIRQRDFSYKWIGDILEVTIKSTSTDNTDNSTYKYYYQNGFLIKEELKTDTYNFKVDLDHKGNKIDFYNIDKTDAQHHETLNRYYDEANKQQKIEFGYHKYSLTALKTPAFYINGKRASDVVWVKGIHPDELIAYDGLKNIYYSITDPGQKAKNQNIKLSVTKIIARNMPNITYSFDGKFIAYVKGKNLVKSRDFAFIGPHLIDYRVEKTVGRTYMVENYKEKLDQNVKELKLISKDTTSIWYSRDLAKDNFFIVHNGKHIDYSKARFEYLSNGDPVIFIDDTPTYVLTRFKEARNHTVYSGKLYNNELESQQNNTTTAKTAVVETPKTPEAKLDCIEGDCQNGWGKLKVNDIITEATFANGNLEGLAYITYPNGAYYHGEYKNNFRDGMGYYKWENGNVYIGYWKNGKQHGYGYTMDAENKITSAGIFENGTLKTALEADYISGKTTNNCLGNCTNGFGKYTYNNGDQYWGFFKNSQRTEVGTYLWSNKSAYTGAYTSDGKRNGYGIYTYVDRSIFKGIFINDQINGLGVMIYNSSGDVVSGVFNNKGAKVKDY